MKKYPIVPQNFRFRSVEIDLKMAVYTELSLLKNYPILSPWKLPVKLGMRGGQMDRLYRTRFVLGVNARVVLLAKIVSTKMNV